MRSGFARLATPCTGGPPLALTHPKTNVPSHGFTPEERAGFDGVVKAGFVDTFRVFEKAGGH